MVKQTEQQKRITALMKSIRQYDKDWWKGTVQKRKTNFELKYDHTLHNGKKCSHYYYNNRYSPYSYEETREIKVAIQIPQKAVVIGDTNCFYMEGTGGASNTDLKRMIRDKEVPDVGVRTCILHSSCFDVKSITLKLVVYKTPPNANANDWWFWYLEELTRYDEKGMAFDTLMKQTNLCEDVIGLIGEYL
jgi:hypothetical protein